MKTNELYLVIYWNNLVGARISKVISNREDLFEYLNQNFIVSDKDTIDSVIDHGELIHINDHSYYYVKQVPFIKGKQTVRPGDYVCILANKLDKSYEFVTAFSDKDVLEDYLKDEYPELSTYQRKRLIAGNYGDDLDVGYARLYK